MSSTSRPARTAKIAVTVPSDRWALRNRVINPRDYIHTAHSATTARPSSSKPAATSSASPPAAGTTENLSGTPGTRETYPALSPDGKTIAFFSDKTGDYQLYTQRAAGGDWTPITTDLDRTVYRLAWSPDGKKILFGNKDYSIFYVDVATKKLVKIDSSNQMKNDEFTWEIADYTWSPDSKWIAYSFVQYNRNSQIFLYNIETGKKVAVTDDFYDNLYPPSTPTANISITSRAATSPCAWTSTRTTTSSRRPSRSWPSSSATARRRRSLPTAGPRTRRRPSRCRSASTPRA